MDSSQKLKARTRTRTKRLKIKRTLRMKKDLLKMRILTMFLRAMILMMSLSQRIEEFYLSLIVTKKKKRIKSKTKMRLRITKTRLRIKRSLKTTKSHRTMKIRTKNPLRNQPMLPNKRPRRLSM